MSVRRVKGVVGKKKRREGIIQEQEEEETGTDRKTDEGIMRRQAGSEKNRAEERQEREEKAPGLWVKVQVARQKRNRDQRIGAPLCPGSNHSYRKPCPGKQ